MNRPFDYVHDINIGYGRLLFPWAGVWIGFAEKADTRIGNRPWWRRLMRFTAFHNCRATGVY